MAHAPTTTAAPVASPHHTVEDASRMVLAGLHIMRPRLSHGYGCPSESGGGCTCGYAELLAGADALIDALGVATPPPEAKKH